MHSLHSGMSQHIMPLAVDGGNAVLAGVAGVLRGLTVDSWSREAPPRGGSAAGARTRARVGRTAASGEGVRHPPPLPAHTPLPALLDGLAALLHTAGAVCVPAAGHTTVSRALPGWGDLGTQYTNVHLFPGLLDSLQDLPHSADVHLFTGEPRPTGGQCLEISRSSELGQEWSSQPPLPSWCIWCACNSKQRGQPGTGGAAQLRGCRHTASSSVPVRSTASGSGTAAPPRQGGGGPAWRPQQTFLNTRPPLPNDPASRMPAANTRALGLPAHSPRVSLQRGLPTRADHLPWPA